MKTHHFASPEISLDFDAALKRASAVADELLGENILSSWCDRERDLESPAHASECHEGCSTKEFWDYALNRGGAGGGFRRWALCVLFQAIGGVRSALMKLKRSGLPAYPLRVK